MRWYELRKLRPGMRVAQHIYSNDRLLLPSGSRLSNKMIQRLPLWGIFQLLVESEEYNSGNNTLPIQYQSH